MNMQINKKEKDLNTKRFSIFIKNEPFILLG